MSLEKRPHLVVAALAANALLIAVAHDHYLHDVTGVEHAHLHLWSDITSFHILCFFVPAGPAGGLAGGLDNMGYVLTYFTTTFRAWLP